MAASTESVPISAASLRVRAPFRALEGESAEMTGAVALQRMSPEAGAPGLNVSVAAPSLGGKFGNDKFRLVPFGTEGIELDQQPTSFFRSTDPFQSLHKTHGESLKAFSLRTIWPLRRPEFASTSVDQEAGSTSLQSNRRSRTDRQSAPARGPIPRDHSRLTTCRIALVPGMMLQTRATRALETTSDRSANMAVVALKRL